MSPTVPLKHPNFFIQKQTAALGLVRLRRIAPGIVPANQSLYKLENQSGRELFRPTNPTQTNKALRDLLKKGLKFTPTYYLDIP
jgi:hypothetical protein